MKFGFIHKKEKTQMTLAGIDDMPQEASGAAPAGSAPKAPVDAPAETPKDSPDAAVSETPETPGNAKTSGNAGAAPYGKQKGESERRTRKNKGAGFTVNGGILFLSAVILVAVTVFVTFFVADKLYYGNALYKESDSVTFSGDDIDKYKTSKFQDILRFIEKNYCLDYDVNAVIEGAINGAVEALGDPYSYYLKPGELQDYQDYITGTYTGIGISYTDSDDGMYIATVEQDSPASEAGLEVGDTVTKINGKSYSEYEKDELTSMFGNAGTELTLTVLKKDGTGSDIKVTVAKVSKQSVFVTDYNGIMHVVITQFDEDTGSEFLTAVGKMESMGCKGMILDLRDNGGGYESQADIVADRILPEGTIAYSEDKNGKRINEVRSDAECMNVPIAVLVNGRTASASELVTGAIRDFKAGTVIGTKTYGKALGQTRQDYSEDGSGIILTVARYFTPSGECIHGKGITPEIIVEQTEQYKDAYASDIPFEEDTQLRAAFDTLNGKIDG